MRKFEVMRTIGLVEPMLQGRQRTGIRIIKTNSVTVGGQPHIDGNSLVWADDTRAFDEIECGGGQSAAH